jgi:glycerol-3-phosphate O-acyltransferase
MLLERYFEAVQVPSETPADLAQLSLRGTVVFVMRSPTILGYLYLQWLTRRLAIPRIGAVVGLTGLGKLIGWLLRARGADALGRVAASGQTALVFLRHPGEGDPFPGLVSLQRAHPRPLLLVPALLVWSRRAHTLKPSLWDLLFGSPEAPGNLATVIAFLRNYRRAFLRLGRPVDLQAFTAERTNEAAGPLGRKVRGALHHHLARETRAVLGPRLKTPARVRDEVLRDRTLRETLTRLTREGDRSPREVERDARKNLKEIASLFSPAFLEFCRPILHWVFHRLYDSVEVDQEGLDRLRRAAAQAPLVLCPSHKSHVDYLILTHVFYEAGMTAPHIAAGINLAFWPFGAIARRGGAFFIRRTLRGDKLYTAVLRAYVKHLLREGFPQEFYVEGGRSRTGKLLAPKTGLLSMEVDAWLDGAADDVLFVPTAVDYEKLVEGTSYAQELAGGEKRKEDFGALLGVRKVLRARYGRIYIQFGTPISLRDLAGQRLGPEVAPAPGVAIEATPEARKTLVQHLANRVAYGINGASTVTPVGLCAAALLSHVRRGISADELGRRLELLRYIAAQGGARLARGLAGAPSHPGQPGTIADTLGQLARDGLIRIEGAAGETIYQVVEDRRPLLDYYRNNVIHRYVSLALVATGLRGTAASGDEAVPLEAVRDRARWLSRLFKLEFMYRHETFEAIFQEQIQFLERGHMVKVDGDQVAVGAEGEQLAFLADLIRAYIESYRVAADTALRAPSPLDRRGLVKLAMERGRAAFLAGRLALREALSKATLENALVWLQQQGYLEPGAGGRLLLTAEGRDGGLEELIAEMDACLNPRSA